MEYASSCRSPVYLTEYSWSNHPHHNLTNIFQPSGTPPLSHTYMHILTVTSPSRSLVLSGSPIKASLIHSQLIASETRSVKSSTSVDHSRKVGLSWKEKARHHTSRLRMICDSARASKNSPDIYICTCKPYVKVQRFRVLLFITNFRSAPSYDASPPPPNQSYSHHTPPTPSSTWTAS